MTDQEIIRIIEMLDKKVEEGACRIKIEISEEETADTVREAYHHGRCDVGSPWAKGTVTNPDC